MSICLHGISAAQTIQLLLAVMYFSAAEENAQDTACGPRVARCVLEWYGRPAPDLKDTIRAIQGTDLRTGASILQLKRFLEDNSLFAIGVNCPNFDIPAWTEPIVLLMRPQPPDSGKANSHHFVLFVAASSNGYTILDPTLGYRELSATEFTKLWTGDALLISRHPISAMWLVGRSFLMSLELMLHGLLLAQLLFLALFLFRTGRSLAGAHCSAECAAIVGSDTLCY